MELLIPNPYWSWMNSILLVHVCLCNLKYISSLKILEKDVKREIGL